MSHRFRALSLAGRRRRRQQRLAGFTLVELLVGGAITVIVVSSLAAIALISELRMGREAEVNQNLRDQWGRALAFINNEAQHAYWIRTSMTTWPCGNGGVPSGPLLVLEGPPNPTNNQPIWTVAYGVRANGQSTEWRGFNRLVRCGPPFEALQRADTPEARRAEALAGNLDYTAQASESVISDQLAQENPFETMLFDETLAKDRDAQLSLFLSRRTGASYPPVGTFQTRFHTQVRANRNPGFDVSGNPACATSSDADGNQVPDPGSCPNQQIKDSLGRTTTIKEHNLPASGTFTVNGCAAQTGCEGSKSSTTTDVIFLQGNLKDFSTKQFSATQSNLPCSRTSCYLSNGKQSVQIYDGDALVFYDGILRL